MTPPLVEGGQGRSAKDIDGDAREWFTLLAFFGVLLLLLCATVFA